jgi:hypothetical protein
MYGRALQCVDTVLTDLPPEGAEDAAGLREQYNIIIQSSAAQSGFDGVSRQGTAQLNAVHKNIFDFLSTLSRSAKIIGRKQPGFEQNFPAPSGKDKNELLTEARAVAPKAVENKALFMKRGIKKEYLESGAEFVEDFEEALGVARGALSSRGEAVGGKASAYDAADEFFDSLNDFVKNYYRDQPQKLAAWKIATRVERSPQKKDAPNPPTA